MADTKRDYYEVLGVEKNATAEEISYSISSRQKSRR